MTRLLTPQQRIELHTIPYLARLLNTTPENATNTKMTWVVIPESPEKKESSIGTLVYYKSFNEIKVTLIELNNDGYSIFLTVNHSGSKARCLPDMKQGRGVWIDFDEKNAEPGHILDLDGVLGTIHPKPDIVVKTPGGWHGYIVFPNPVNFDSDSARLYKSLLLGLQQNYAVYGADPKVCDVSRIMRVPGFFHWKGDPILVTSEYVSAPRTGETTESLIAEIQQWNPYELPGNARGGFKFEYQTTIPEETRYELALEWLEQKAEAIQGDDGSGALMSAAWVGPRFALEYETAFELLMEDYNPRCDPEWSDYEMHHKLQDAYKSATEASLFGFGLPDYHENKLQACLEVFPAEDANDEETVSEEGEESSSDFTEEEMLDQQCSMHDASDLGLAHRLRRRFGKVLQYWNHTWYHFNGMYWEPRPDGPMKLLEKTIKKVEKKEIHLVDDQKRRDHIWKWAQGLGSRSRIDAAIHLGTSLMARRGPFEIPSSTLINFNNGTLDLSTGRLKEHDPLDCFLYCLPFDYKSEKSSPTWLRYLQTVFMGDSELIDFVQSLIGCTLLSTTDDEFAVWLSGDGSNGKTTFTETVSHALGRLAQQIPNDLFLTKKYGHSHPTEIARLHQVKFATCSDISLNAKLDEGTFKRLVTTGMAAGRYMHKDFFEFTISHKFWISVNNLPSVYDESHGVWRRMIVIPFNRKFTSSDRDGTIKRRLKDEVEGIWAWMVQGAIRFHKSGMPPRPEAVIRASAAWQSNEDWWENFTLEECQKAPGEKAPLGQLFEAYQNWARRTLRAPISLKSFSNKVKQSGFRTYKSSITYVEGLGLKLHWGMDMPDESLDGL